MIKKVIIILFLGLNTWGQNFELKLEKKITVSGISSGGYFAHQFHIIHSELVEGAAIFAAGPYGCAGGDALIAMNICMKGAGVFGQGARSNAAIRWVSSFGILPTPSNLSDDRVFIFSGKEDSVVSPYVSNELNDLYGRLGVNDVKYVNDISAGHTYPTQKNGVDCESSVSPYIGNCSYSGAIESMKWLYPDKKAHRLTRKGKFKKISQDDYRRSFYLLNPMMGELAYLYIPARCAKGKRCSLHVAFHGCAQTISDIGTSFMTETQITQAADLYDVVVLFPQAIRSSKLGSNPNGCWDWWGYTGFDYQLSTGPQVELVYRMIKDLLK